MGLGEVVVLDFFGVDSAIDIVRLCDPRVKLDSEEDFVRFWVQTKTAIDKFLASANQRLLASQGDQPAQRAVVISH